MYARFKLFILFIFLYAPSVLLSQTEFKTGIWRGVLKLNDSAEVPFNFEIKKKNTAFLMDIINQEEHILIDNITFSADSVFMVLADYDSEFRLKMKSGQLQGNWISYSGKDPVSIPFNATFNERRRFLRTANAHPVSKERWKVTFNPGLPNEKFSVGLFETINNKTTGTFATETGDYRYLEGFSDSVEFMVSAFDGAHAYLFYATRKNGKLVNGHFYSGKTGYRNWIAAPDDQFELSDPYTLTYLKPDYSKMDFSFKNQDGKTISLNDEAYKNKVVIVQIMGSWCPNCIDETKFLTEFYRTYKSKGVEIIGLAFERSTDFLKASEKIKNLKKRLTIPYEILLPETSGKDPVAEALPMINKIMAFPTTIYIDKKGEVRKIYTGFYGPATRDKYQEYVNETTSFIESLLKE